MKKLLINILFIGVAFSLTQCFEEKEKVVAVIPTEDIEEKLRELRDLQREINDEDVESADLQAQIDKLTDDLNNLIPPGNVPLTYSIGIISAKSGANAGVSGAVVTINVRDEIQTATTGSAGQVAFENLRSGMATVNISHPDFTDVSYVVDLRVNDAATDEADKTGQPFNVTSVIALYPTSAANGAMVLNGRIFFDPDRTNDIVQTTDPNYGRIGFFDNNYNATDGPYAPAPELTLTNGNEDAVPTELAPIDARVQSWVNLDRAAQIFVSVSPSPTHYGYVPAGTEGNIVVAVYEDMFIRATSTATGTFTLTLPSADITLTHRYRLSEFVGDELYPRARNLNTTTNITTTSNRTRKVVYTAMYMEYGQTDLAWPGNLNAFDASKVNAFTINWPSSWTGLPLNIYYSAKTRDE